MLRTMMSLSLNGRRRPGAFVCRLKVTCAGSRRRTHSPWGELSSADVRELSRGAVGGEGVMLSAGARVPEPITVMTPPACVTERVEDERLVAV
jgi:hypothetical protein